MTEAYTKRAIPDPAKAFEGMAQRAQAIPCQLYVLPHARNVIFYLPLKYLHACPKVGKCHGNCLHGSQKMCVVHLCGAM